VPSQVALLYYMLTKPTTQTNTHSATHSEPNRHPHPLVVIGQHNLQTSSLTDFALLRLLAIITALQQPDAPTPLSWPWMPQTLHNLQSPAADGSLSASVMPPPTREV
jgi:hypothetical protein